MIGAMAHFTTRRPVALARRQTGLAIAASAMLLTAGCGHSQRDPADTLKEANAALARNDWHGADAVLKAATRDGGGNPALQVLAARVALEQGDAARAAMLLQAVQRDGAAELPADTAASLRPLLAKALMAEGNGAAALETIGSDDPGDPVSAAVKVRALSLAGNGGPAMALLDKALVRWPQATDLLVLDGLRASAAGNRARADAVGGALAAQAPDDFEAVLFTGQLALSEGRKDDARAIFARANRLRPDHQVPMLALAGLARAAGDSAGERNWLNRARQAAPGDVWIALYLAQLALDAGHADEAARLLSPFADKPNGNNALRLLAGLSFAQVGRKEDAINQLNAYVLHGGDDGRARFALAVLLSEKGNVSEAWTVLKPLAMTANAAPAPLQLAARLAAANRDAAAPALAARAAAANRPDPAAAAMVDAQAAIRAKDWARADAIYARVLAQPGPATAIAYNNAAFVKIELGHAADAVALARKALALAPDDAVTMDTLGLALLRAQTGHDEAVRLLREAARRQPANPEIRAHLAEAGG